MIYFDNAATTAVSPRAAKKAAEVMLDGYGNPSSLHIFGTQALREIDKARDIISAEAGCEKSELFFTSGGTESNNIALFGAANAYGRRGKHIILPAVEHASVIKPVQELCKRGYEATVLSPDSEGRITAEAFENALRNDTVLVSCMLVNNETGIINPVAQIKDMLVRRGSSAMLHCDAVQGFMKLTHRAEFRAADIITLSGHKLHAPKGTGCIIVKKGVRLTPLFYGGGQEDKLRAGTEAVPLIAAFGEAALEFRENAEEYRRRMPELKRYALGRLSGLQDVRIISGGDAPHILMLSVPGKKSETLMHFLARREIYVSSGSACTKGKNSHVLEAMGVERRIAEGALRLSFSLANTEDEIDIFADALCEACAQIKN